MQIYFYSVSFLLTFAIVLIHAKNIHFDSNDQLDDNSNGNDQQRPIHYINRNPHKPQSFHQKFLNLFKGEETSPYDQQRTSAIARRTKAIVKGDPREFMG